jgi:putative methyltransferase (TIGR04325 family)
VVETPAIVRASHQFEQAELAFFDNIEAAHAHLGDVDMLHTSGTLQCVNRPKVYLSQLMAINAPFMLFNRMGLNRKHEDVVTIHHSKLSWNGHPGLPPNVQDRAITYPFTFRSEQDFLKQLEAQYRIVARFSDNSGILSLPTAEIVGGGLLVQQK